MAPGPPSWISAHCTALEFFQGVLEIIMPDNLKAGVTRACRYEPDLNPTYQEMAACYDTAIIPAQPRKPKDTTCQWIQQHQRILFVDPTSVGKTFLACALGNAACRQGYRTRPCRVPPLLHDLVTAKADGSYPRLMNTLVRTEVLVLDDWRLAPISTAEPRDILWMIDDRTQQRSTIVTGRLPLDHWSSSIGDHRCRCHPGSTRLRGAQTAAQGGIHAEDSEVPANDRPGTVKAQTHRRFAPTTDLAVGFKRNTRRFESE